MLETVNNFISMVEANQHVEAIELFYADNVIIQDNHSAETRSKQKALENEKKCFQR